MPTPTLIIHGGAGAITRKNLSPKAWAEYSANLSRIYRSTAALLDKGVSALDAATHAVVLFEDCKLFNCGKGAVFTRDGTIELEASMMVTHPYRKRYCAVVLLSHVKHPIKFVREMLIRGEHDGSSDDDSGGEGDPAGGSSGAQGHSCLSGDGAEKLAKEWGLEMVEPKYFWTRKRWEQHRKGLGKPTKKKVNGDKTPYSCALCTPEVLPSCGYDLMNDHEANCLRDLERVNDSINNYPGNDDEDNDDGGDGWDGIEYLPQGTVGCVALDRDGAMCVATSTGGLTNKLAGRIGDTPTVGAGFWAEEWAYNLPPAPLPKSLFPPATDNIVSSFQSFFLGDCLRFDKTPKRYHHLYDEKEPATRLRAVALSGTGNGDSFLRLSACRTAGAIVRFSPPPPEGLLPVRTLASAVNQITGPGGELQQSAGDRWGKTGEGEAGMIGIEFLDDGKGNAKGEIVFDFNCGGMFRCWIDAEGKERVMVFKEEY